MSIVTTLNFAGRTEEALEFYVEVLGGKTVFLMRFRESPDQSFVPPGAEDLIFHATFRIEDTEFMASDVGYTKGKKITTFSGFSLVLKLRSIKRAKRIFASLGEDGQVVVPLARSAFTSWYGIVTDRFGVSWKINVAGKDPANRFRLTVSQPKRGDGI
ncbi:MAG TPA: VOC family protein [Lacunisphaera sp.]|nr:VOC family protein [Lacunisphaera sp.]